MILTVVKQKILRAFILLAFVFGSLYLIKTSGERGLLSVMSILSGCITLAWIIFSGNNWWILMPVSVAFGGTFLYEYKFYVHEISLIICMIALLPVVALRRKDLPRRGPLPWSFYGLLAVFVINCATSCYMSESQEAASLGSIARAFLQGFWAVLFGVLFYWYGLLKPRLLLSLLYVAFLARAALGIVVAIFEDFFVIPKVGFAFMSATAGVFDFRVTGIQLALIGYVFAQLAKQNLWKMINYGIMIVAVLLVALGGGRVSVGMICSVPLVWGLIQKRIGTLAVICALGLSLIFILNQYPSMLYKFPDTAQRALSMLVAETSTKWMDWHTYNQASDYWHSYLSELGWQRWTQNPMTLILGNRVSSFDETFNAYSVTLEIKAEIAARLGSFESGLWTVLVLVGGAGALLYIGIFYFLLRQPFDLLRKEGIKSPAHAFAFLAIIQLSLWILFCWIAGGFPSYELMMAIFAKAACTDEKSMTVPPQTAELFSAISGKI